MGVSSDNVKTLREQTGAGMLDCKKALVECDGDLQAAAEYLRKKGIAKAAKYVDRQASEGLVHAYVHPGGKIGVLVEVNCQTDFVARTEEFKSLVNDIALQVAATAPLALKREEVDQAVIDKEKEIYRSQALEEGKPEKVVDRIVDGKLAKFFEEACLLEQISVKDQERRIEAIVQELSGKVGEKIVIRRFTRFQLGDAS
jgi:elongation factor Ts